MDDARAWPMITVIQQHRLTVGNLNDYIFPAGVRHHGIRSKGPAGNGCSSLFAIMAQDCNFATMNLPGENKLVCSHHTGDDTPVCGNIFLGIANTETNIQTCKGRLTVPGVAGKDPVIDPAVAGQIFKLVKRYAVLSRKYHLISPAGAIPGFFQ